MNVSKSKRILKKINKLHETLTEENQIPSKIEKDLLLSYIRELYDSILQDAEEFVVSESVNVAEHNKMQSSKSENSKLPGQVNHVVKTEKPQIDDEIIVAEDQNKNGQDPEIISLFDSPKVKDLSDRLSMIPVKDLSKSVGINEKVLNIKELFGGDHSYYEQVISDLNALDNFEEASNYLIEKVAGKFGWTAKNKKDKVANFIKLVRRRYL